MQTVTLSAKAVAAWIICLMQITSYTLRIVIGPDFKIRSGYFYQFESPRPDWLDSDFIPRLLEIFEKLKNFMAILLSVKNDTYRRIKIA